MAPIGSIDLGAIMHVGLFAETVAISGEMLLRYSPQRRPTYFRNRQLTAQTHFPHHRTRKSQNGRRQRGLYLRQEKLLPPSPLKIIVIFDFSSSSVLTFPFLAVSPNASSFLSFQPPALPTTPCRLPTLSCTTFLPAAL